MPKLPDYHRYAREADRAAQTHPTGVPDPIPRDLRIISQRPERYLPPDFLTATAGPAAAAQLAELLGQV